MLLAFVFEEYSHQTKSTVCDDDILAVAQGSPDALHILYEKTAKSVYAYTLSLLKTTQDVYKRQGYIRFFKIIHNLSSFR